MTPVSPQVEHLKGALDKYLQEHDMYAQIRELVGQVRTSGRLTATKESGDAAGADVFDAVEEAGLIDDLIKAMAEK